MNLDDFSAAKSSYCSTKLLVLNAPQRTVVINALTVKQIWVFPKIGVPQNGFIMENPIKMDDLGVPLFSETPKYSQKTSKTLCISGALMQPSKILMILHWGVRNEFGSLHTSADMTGFQASFSYGIS